MCVYIIITCYTTFVRWLNQRKEPSSSNNTKPNYVSHPLRAFSVSGLPAWIPLGIKSDLVLFQWHQW